MTERKYFPEEKHAGKANAEASMTPNDFKKKKSEVWDIAGLEAFFEVANIPEGTVVLSSGEKIINVKLFIESHMRIIKLNNGKTFQPYYERLIRLREIIENKEL
jgi:hypothetical protein